MNIFTLLVRQTRNGAVTLRFPERLPNTRDFRGPVNHDPTRCIVCGGCAYVCPSAAIRLDEAADHDEWTYDPGRCTFCGRCADICISEALQMDEKPATPYENPAEQRKTSVVPRPVCKRCGAPMRRVNEKFLRRIYGEVTLELREIYDLCERCRRLRVQEALAAKELYREP